MSMDISTEDEQLARQAISLFELMALDVDDTESRIVGLCQRAMTPLGPIAAICVYPRFVLLARTTLDRLQHRDIRVVAVVNFPYGSANEEAVMSETRAAVMSGADEIDLVYPFRTLLSGDQQTGANMVASCRAACGPDMVLTVTLEVGDLRDPQIIRDACLAAIIAGANFIKTSTGKLVTPPTTQAVRVMLESLVDVGGQVGLKFCGGLRTLNDARLFIEMARARFGPQWVSDQRVRLVGSSLLDDILSQLGVVEPGSRGNGY
ncbi:deoxyribose-phosphate aldolase [Pseudomonas sp. Irchel 3A5]|jgi:deoxyribose-phosphate aldolase|uniref:deoxyribose-phosphate aldolase n=1 Tax=Pseudomonas sp. Irchel 3A5 TaxID=2008911 RepID=UPI000BA3BF02|nr:deoxyribose-phosphate aldolase [Pseudomonas sp. Irchel 3A5]